MQKPLDLKCPHCGTAYQVVQVQTDTYTDAEIDCLMCGQPLQTGDGDSFFKYFLVYPSWLSRQQLLALHHDTLHHDDVCELQGGRQ
jgi:transcription elongation factor Elf1